MSELIHNQELRIKTLKEVILHLRQGEAPAAVRAPWKSLVADVTEEERGGRRLLEYGKTAEQA
jgi:hypothetical protein